MIRIKKEININYIEKLYEKLHSSTENLDLLIPKELKEVTFFSMPSFFQFIITWLRQPNSGELFFDIKLDKTNEELEDVFKQYHFFVVSSLIWRNKGVKNKESEGLKDILRKTNEDIHKLMSVGKKIKGNSLLLASFDDLPRNRGLLKIFYNSKNELFPETNIEQYIFSVFKDLGTFFNQRMFSNLSRAVKDVSAIVYELYKNTDQWATTSHEGDFLNQSLRAIYFKLHRNERTHFIKQSEENTILQKYFNHVIFQADEVDRISFLEISVLDSGKGFIGRLLGGNKEKEMATTEEVNWVKRCLTKNFTIEEGKNKDTKGVGLDRVLKLLDKKGFLRIRTNRVCLCRDLITDCYNEENNPDKIKVFDWKTGSTSAFTSMPPTEGTVVSIIIPLFINNII